MTKETLIASDLLDWAEHEHEHMTRLFEDLNETFVHLSAGGVEDQDDILSQAIDDLSGALEDTLEHFNEEEEVYFAVIEQRFPEFSDDIEQLIQTHEFICEQIKSLKRQIAHVMVQEEVSPQIFEQLSAQVQRLVESMSEHNEQEHHVFHEALARLTKEERQALMETKHALG